MKTLLTLSIEAVLCTGALLTACTASPADRHDTLALFSPVARHVCSCHVSSSDQDKDDATANKDDSTGSRKDNPFSGISDNIGGEKWGVVAVNDKDIVVGIPAEAGALSPTKRAEIIAKRFNDLYHSGAKFKNPSGYLVGTFHGEVIVALKQADPSAKPMLIVTVDTNTERKLREFNKDKRVTRGAIAAHWVDCMCKSLQKQPNLSHTPHAWAKIPERFFNKPLPELKASQFTRPNGG